MTTTTAITTAVTEVYEHSNPCVAHTSPAPAPLVCEEEEDEEEEDEEEEEEEEEDEEEEDEEEEDEEEEEEDEEEEA